MSQLAHLSNRSLKSINLDAITAALLTCQSVYSPCGGLESVTFLGTSASCAHSSHQFEFIGSGTLQEWYATFSQYASLSQLLGDARSTSIRRSCSVLPRPLILSKSCIHSCRFASSEDTKESGSLCFERRACSYRIGLRDLRYLASESESLGTGKRGRVD